MSNSETHRGILVGVDRSAWLMAAVKWAARDAAMRNVPLTLVHVVPQSCRRLRRGRRFRSPKSISSARTRTRGESSKTRVVRSPTALPSMVRRWCTAW